MKLNVVALNKKKNVDRFLFFTKIELAQIFSVVPSAVTKWSITPSLVEGGREFFYLPDVIQYRDKMQTCETKSLSLERAQLAHEQSEKTRIEIEIKKIELAKTRGEFVSVEETGRAWENIALNLKAKLLAIPCKCASIILSLSSAIEVEKYLKKEMLEVLEMLSKTEIAEDIQKEEELQNASDTSL